MSGFNNPERINEELEDVIRGRSTNSLTHEDFLTEPTIVRTTHPARCPQCGSKDVITIRRQIRMPDSDAGVLPTCHCNHCGCDFL
jgi:DNA-directed RNA polymerase subunit M/transcription elongation factor TFIIS